MCCGIKVNKELRLIMDNKIDDKKIFICYWRYMQIRQKASAMTDKKAVLFKQTLPSRFISFSKIQKNYHIHTKTIKPVILFHKK